MAIELYLTSKGSFDSLILMTKLGYVIFGLILIPFLASADVVINEIAWMGTDTSSSDEWVELYNSGSENVDLTDWVLTIQDKKDILLENNISSGAYYLIERTDDDAVPTISADLIHSFGAGLVNSGAVLILKNANSNEVDRVDASAGWPAGDNASKETMQRTTSGWVTATGTPRAQNFGFAEQQSEEPESVPEVYVPLKSLPTIKVNAGQDKTMVAGAIGEFRGEAFGFENEPLENARYLWNFGDGSLAEGQNVTHFYKYPGEYLVVLDVSSGGYTSSDRLAVKVVVGNVFISEVKNGMDSFVEIKNESDEEINIYGWQFRHGFQKFTFSKNTFLRPRAFIVIPILSSGILLAQNNGVVDLLYPGGSLASSFRYNGFLAEGQSFSRKGDSSVITEETPGKDNLIPVAQVTAQVTKSVSVEPVIVEETKEETTGGRPVDLSEPYQDQDKAPAMEANVVGSKISYYFFAVGGLVLFAGIGVLLVRRQSGV